MLAEPPTCVSDAVVLTLASHVVDDYHPNQRRAHHTTHNHHHHNAHCSPAIRVVATASRLTVRRGGDAEVNVSTLCAECVGHNAGVLPCICRPGIHDNKQLIGCCKKVTLSQQQRSVVFCPIQARSGAPTSYALKNSSLTTCHCTIL